MVVKEHGTPRTEEKLYNHVDLVQLLDIVDLEKGTVVAGALKPFTLHPAQPMTPPWLQHPLKAWYHAVAGHH